MLKVLISLIVASLSLSSRADAAPPCKTNTKLVAACFVVHGRLADWYQGSYPVRIWVRGTNRLLGVIDTDQLKDARDGPILPDNVSKALGDGPAKPYFVFGDFTVCPLSHERPGWMREVCLESATHLVAKPASAN
jgi:hypothetical protein